MNQDKTPGERDLRSQAKDAAGAALGRASDLAGDAVEAGRGLAERAESEARDGAKMLRREVSQSPFLAVVMAAVVGYVIALVLHGGAKPRGRARDARGRFIG